ncbi:MAG: UTP--glucose-1-phosphate uridylyltransferase [Chloroflexi bacterium]|nr:UTP--glucose-1-phosphate uridylyltransferase [Chloroflexota bacterium]
MNVRKAVIPAAGFGTRFLPVTRSVPKVLLPVLDTPSIHYMVEEAAQSGIRDIAIVISEGQEALTRYFNPNAKLEKALASQGKDELVQRLRAISDMANITYVHQAKALGLGHAVLMGRDFVGDEPFAVFLPDDLIWAEKPTIRDMTAIYEQHQGSVIAVREATPERVPNLGIIDPEHLAGNLIRVKRMVEKPRLEDAPSRLGVIGRYVLDPQVFSELENGKPGALGEIQLTDAINALAQKKGVYAYEFPGVHIDVGVPSGLVKASVYEALHRGDDDLRQWLRGLLDDRK